MSLAAALANNPRKPKTRLDEIWAALDDESERVALLAILNDPDLSHRDVARLLAGEGHPISKTTVGDARAIGWAKSKETS